MLTCRQVTDRANDYLDGELGFWPTMEVRMHLLACRYCRAFMKQMRTAIRLIDEYGFTLPPDVAPQYLMDAFRRRTRGGHGGSGSGATSTQGDV